MVVPLALTVLVWTLGEMIHSPVAQAYRMHAESSDNVKESLAYL